MCDLGVSLKARTSIKTHSTGCDCVKINFADSLLRSRCHLVQLLLEGLPRCLQLPLTRKPRVAQGGAPGLFNASCSVLYYVCNHTVKPHPVSKRQSKNDQRPNIWKLNQQKCFHVILSYPPWYRANDHTLTSHDITWTLACYCSCSSWDRQRNSCWGGVKWPSENKSEC